ncbi:DinI-like family protein [Enterobacter oligotrophicus]|mgnify:FL=1|uniref:DinI-like family protein n=1 Tax=Enterobacter oligotrophicus TaxID=2478464 RepID=UPI0023F2B8BF|nr:DinI-like family protein [Enterobacter oligotrophicus]
MKVELTIDRTKKLPDGAVPALEKELLKRLNNQYENCSLIIRCAGSRCNSSSASIVIPTGWWWWQTS